MYLSSILNILLVGTATLIASTPNAQCNAAHLRAVSSSAKPSTDEMVYAEKTWWESSKYTSTDKEPGYGYDQHKPGCDHKKPDYHHEMMDMDTTTKSLVITTRMHRMDMIATTLHHQRNIITLQNQIPS